MKSFSIQESLAVPYPASLVYSLMSIFESPRSAVSPTGLSRQRDQASPGTCRWSFAARGASGESHPAALGRCPQGDVPCTDGTAPTSC